MVKMVNLLVISGFAVIFISLWAKTDLMTLVLVNLVDLSGPGPVPIFFRLVRFLI